jgi:acyl-CoA thioester hydrolase
MTASAKPAKPGQLRHSRAAFKTFVPLETRWHDNDIYGHINSVVCHEFFETAIAQVLMQSGAFENSNHLIIGLAAETQCLYFERIAFPDKIDVGVAVEHIGRSAVRYRLGIFKRGAENPSAQGMAVFCYVGKSSFTPMPITPEIRSVLGTLLVKD